MYVPEQQNPRRKFTVVSRVSGSRVVVESCRIKPRRRRELGEKYDDSLVGLGVETLLFAVTAATGKRRSGFKSLLEKK
jgi:hypothetical protein